jgi:DNA repair exonuclease SbcCD ATPase subunit
VKHETWLSFAEDSREALDVLKEIGLPNKELARAKNGKLGAQLASLKDEISLLDKSIKNSASKRSRLESQLEDQQRRKSSLLAKRTNLSKDLDVCPTCGANYDNKHAKMEMAKVTKSLTECKEELKQLQGYLDNFEDTSSSQKSLEDLELSYSKAKALSLKISACLDTIDSTQAEPYKPELSKQEIASRLESCSKTLSLLADWQSVFSVENDWARLPQKVKSSEGFKETQENFLAINEECLSLSVSVQRSEDALKSLVALKAKVKGVKARVKDLPSLQLLESAFSKKGVESVMLKNLASSLEAQVNKYAKLIFPEDFRFSFELDTQFSILVSRKYGAKEVTSDVRKLSGAEKKLFAIVLMISLLTFVPASRRSNLLILDEPTAAMGAENLARFIRFLPVLQTVIPTIVVITPLDPKDYSSITPQTFVVTKDRSGKSTIERSDK